MEQKTIGSFIAALRKANGMTQKELAERLHISDKTVSRWECGESAPDLSLIPVIAEIFGVSCDELLRGERRSPADRAEQAETDARSQKCEKQKKRILAACLSRFRTKSFIALGLALVGLIAAMFCNFGFNRAWIGCFAAFVFYLAAIVAEAVFVNTAFLSVDDDPLSAIEAGRFRRSVLLLAEFVFGFCAVLCAFTLPLVLYPFDAHVGLSKDSWFGYGALFGGIALLLVLLACHFLNAWLLKKGVYTLGEKGDAVYWRNLKRKRLIGLCLACVLIATAVVHELSTALWGPYSVMEGTTFHDYESFVAFMETDVPVDALISHGPEAPAASAAEAVEDPAYYDQYGNAISEEEALRRTLEDSDGNVVCEYIDRNKSVSSIRYSPGEGTVLPITVCTYDDLYEAQARVKNRHAVFACIYAAEVAAALLLYFLKREK